MGELSRLEREQIDKAKQTIALSDSAPLLYPGLTKDRAQEILHRYRKPKNWIDSLRKRWDNWNWNR